MTGWHIRSGYSSHANRAEVDEVLSKVVAEVRQDTDALIAEAGDADADLVECLEHYRTCCDATLTERRDESGLEYMLLASGGGRWRDVKEEARRVFVRLVMRRMHARSYDISLTVA